MPINFILSYSTKFHRNLFDDSLTITCRQSDGYMANVIGLILFFISNASKNKLKPCICVRKKNGLK